MLYHVLCNSMGTSEQTGTVLCSNSAIPGAEYAQKGPTLISSSTNRAVVERPTILRNLHQEVHAGGAIMLHNTTHPHVAHTVWDMLHSMHWKVLDNHPHNSVPSLCAVHVFSPTEKVVKGCRFRSDQDMKATITEWVQQQLRASSVRWSTGLFINQMPAWTPEGTIFNNLHSLAKNNPRTGFIWKSLANKCFSQSFPVTWWKTNPEFKKQLATAFSSVAIASVDGLPTHPSEIWTLQKRLKTTHCKGTNTVPLCLSTVL